MLLGIRLSQRGPTEQHPFGYGMEVYFWSLVIAIVTFGVGGAVSIAEGIHNLLRPEALTRPLWNYVVLLVSFLADGWTLIIGYREFRAAGAGAGPAEAGIWTGIRDSKDPSRFIVILEDGAATIGVLIAVLGVWLSDRTGDARFDAAASILIGALVCAVGLVLARESKHLLLGEGARRPTVDAIRRTVLSDPEVRAVRNLLTMHLGPAELLLNLDVEFNPDLDFPEIAQAIERLESNIRKEHPEVKRIFIEARNLGSRAAPAGAPASATT
jgi:cation diffusion facilitator family transporter